MMIMGMPTIVEETHQDIERGHDLAGLQNRYPDHLFLHESPLVEDACSVAAARVIMILARKRLTIEMRKGKQDPTHAPRPLPRTSGIFLHFLEESS